MKKAGRFASLALAASSVFALAQAPVASAATYTMQGSKITVNGSVLSQPPKFVYQSTTYMPIYYVNTVLQKLGFSTTWDGHNWGINGSINSNGLYLNAQSGNSFIYVNGKLVADHVVMVQTTDPYSHNLTTFMPIWYIQQVLDNLLKTDKTTDVWSGYSWTINSSVTSTTSGSGSVGTGGSATQSEADQAMSIYESITWTTQGTYRVFSIPFYSLTSDWMIDAGTGVNNTVQCSYDNGYTWHGIDIEYESRDSTLGGTTSLPSGVTHVLLRIPVGETTYIGVTKVRSSNNTAFGQMTVTSSGTKSIDLNAFN